MNARSRFSQAAISNGHTEHSPTRKTVAQLFAPVNTNWKSPPPPPAPNSFAYAH